MKKFLLLTFFILAFSASGAKFPGTTPAYCLDGIDFLSGYAEGTLRPKEKYRLIPFFLDFNFDIKPNQGYSQLLQFQVEPFLSLIMEPKDNIETGVSFFLKAGIFPKDWKLQPYFKVGVGTVYMTLHTLEQSTQFNFIEQIGGGLHFFLQKNTALTFEYRYRHLSNASIKRPNKGIETSFFLAGVSYLF